MDRYKIFISTCSIPNWSIASAPIPIALISTCDYHFGNNPIAIAINMQTDEFEKIKKEIEQLFDS